MKKIAAFLLLICTLSWANAQLSHESTQKPHFRIFTNDPSVSNLEKYVSVCAEYIDFDQFRLQSERRVLKFQFVEVYIELYSGDELVQLYGKPLSPLTILHGQSYRPVEFYITDESQPRLDYLVLKVPEVIYP